MVMCVNAPSHFSLIATGIPSFLMRRMLSWRLEVLPTLVAALQIPLPLASSLFCMIASRVMTAIYQRLMKKKPSGWNEEKFESETLKAFGNEQGGKKFKSMDAWRHLRDHAKFALELGDANDNGGYSKKTSKEGTWIEL